LVKVGGPKEVSKAARNFDLRTQKYKMAFRIGLFNWWVRKNPVNCSKILQSSFHSMLFSFSATETSNHFVFDSRFLSPYSYIDPPHLHAASWGVSASDLSADESLDSGYQGGLFISKCSSTPVCKFVIVIHVIAWIIAWGYMMHESITSLITFSFNPFLKEDEIFLFACWFA